MMNLALFSSTFTQPNKKAMRLFLLILSMTFLSQAQSSRAFTDIAPSDTSYAIFTHLDAVNIMNSRNGAFQPDALVTRAEALTVALRAGGVSIPNEFGGQFYYADVDPNQWYTPVIARAVETKILTPPFGNFRPDEPVEKAEFLTMLFRAGQVDLRPFYTARNVAEDIPNDSWMQPFFAYAKRYQIAHLPADGYYLPSKNLSRREVALMTYRQLRVFHGSTETKLLVELQGSIQQFLEFIRHGKTAEAEFQVHSIMALNDRIMRSHNNQDAVAAMSISRSMEHLSDSLRYFKYGKNLRGISELHLALKQAERAETKSVNMAPFANELAQIIGESLQAYTQPSLGTFTLNE
jgi:hypothetical protein